MKFELVELEQISGEEATLYSVRLEEEFLNLFDKFIQENINDYEDELKNMVTRLEVIGKEEGAREQYVKIHEGNPGDHICALYDRPDKHLRLYCIRYNSMLLVLGGGGPKPKSIQALQEDPKLKAENYLLREIATAIEKARRAGDLQFSADGSHFEGDLTIDTDYL